MVVKTVGWSSTSFRQLPLRLSSPTLLTPEMGKDLEKVVQKLSAPHTPDALVALELARYNIDIAALSETRLHGEDSLSEVGAGYTFFWKGVPEGTCRNHGVGFAVKSKLLQHIPESPIGINERLMTWRIPLAKERFATLISAYAPTLDAKHNIKEDFYRALDAIIQKTPATDRLILMGDLNARVGTEHLVWPKVIGQHGVGKMNHNGLRLLSLCAEHQLVITNTIFQMKNRLKTTWQHPRSKHWHLLDYVIVRQKDRKDVLTTRVMRGVLD
ncbi:Craniofacial development protein 2 [Merluccius polli]|uniref:Craniofacial development protein 2 n=1 Tax=Merluccius polli TaxID=89951 RepID=A0AA47M4J3_MERPO|nr:Craniofacial development protein 2 [Merluccius polli]